MRQKELAAPQPSVAQDIEASTRLASLLPSNGAARYGAALARGRDGRKLILCYSILCYTHYI